MPKFTTPSNAPSWEPGVPTGPTAPPSAPNRPDLSPNYVVTQGDIAQMEKKVPQKPAQE